MDNGYGLFVFEVPAAIFKKEFLWSDYFDWHLLLNDIEGTDWESIFDPPKDKSVIRQGISAYVNKKWIKKIIKKN